MRSDKMGVKDVLDFEVPGRTDGLTFGNASVTVDHQVERHNFLADHFRF